MLSCPVSRAVNSPRNDDPSLTEPVDPELERAQIETIRERLVVAESGTATFTPHAVVVKRQKKLGL